MVMDLAISPVWTGCRVATVHDISRGISCLVALDVSWQFMSSGM